MSDFRHTRSKSIRTMSEPRDVSDLETVAWSPDGTKIASFDQQFATVVVWTAESGAIDLSFRAHSSNMYELGWSEDGTHLTTYGYDYPHGHPVYKSEINDDFDIPDASGFLSLFLDDDDDDDGDDDENVDWADSDSPYLKTWDAATGELRGTRSASSRGEILDQGRRFDPSANNGIVEVHEDGNGFISLRDSRTNEIILSVGVSFSERLELARWSPDYSALAWAERGTVHLFEVGIIN